MNIALIGSGGREHALCKKIFDSKYVKKIICIPGNPGTSRIAENIDINFLNFPKLLKTLKSHDIDLVVIGPEEPLVKGIVDYLNKKKIKVFGPNKFAAKLEGSKSFMKTICKRYGIPTAKFKICKNIKEVNNFVKNCEMPLVVKADGLAAGKGVSICKTKGQIMKFSKDIFKGKFRSSKKLVIEEFLGGEEASYFLVVDKKGYKFFGSAQDHKRVGENDIGANTGGMGAYSPAPIINKSLENKILRKIVEPTLAALKEKKQPYTGFLYVGLMIKKNNPYLIEYNIRMGDPECQVILPRLKTDIVKIFSHAVKNKISRLKLEWKKTKCMTVVLCSKGYPGKYNKGHEIKNIDFKKKDLIVYHAGTKIFKNKLLSNGGRVLNITGTGNAFKKIRFNILKVLKQINWTKGFYRRDIGWRVINKQ
tara:strand:- start:7618 stop:8880 length:1263 start_codon:yes stop_codon:yes gene_type:complete